MTPTILHDTLAAGAGVAGSLGKWSPDSAETVHDRLSTIVGSAMGYEPEDLPWEVPLIELGLDSLMAVRIKNRVEYDFDLPPIQLTAVRDANLYAVEKLIEYAIENRETVSELHEHQKTLTPEQIAAEQAAIAAGEIPPELAAKLAAKHPELHSDAPPPPPPTAVRPGRTERRRRPGPVAGRGRRQGPEPAGGRRGPRHRCPAAGGRRTHHLRHLGHRHRQVAGWHLQRTTEDQRRDRGQDRRTTFRTRRGHHHRRAGEGATTIEELATDVREYLEAGELEGFVRTLRAPKEGVDACRCSCSTRPVARRWSTSH